MICCVKISWFTAVFIRQVTLKKQTKFLNLNVSRSQPKTATVTVRQTAKRQANSVVHYCVSNIPGAVAHSTSVALAAETLPLLLNIMNNGLKEACVRDGFIRRCLTAYKGYLTHEETSAIQNKPQIRPEDILGIADRKLDFAPPATTTKSNNFIKL